jgi:hypothetical protein
MHTGQALSPATVWHLPHIFTSQQFFFMFSSCLNNASHAGITAAQRMPGENMLIKIIIKADNPR